MRALKEFYTLKFLRLVGVRLKLIINPSQLADISREIVATKRPGLRLVAELSWMDLSIHAAKAKQLHHLQYQPTKLKCGRCGDCA